MRKVLLVVLSKNATKGECLMLLLNDIGEQAASIVSTLQKLESYFLENIVAFQACAKGMLLPNSYFVACLVSCVN